ncbi:MAG TPA: hypothetical protein VL171_18100 [Verrucomicrobiae bacterium]|nr:hypothetical protein [Verrucomicrobiae bacterium]
MNPSADFSADVNQREPLFRVWQRLHEFCAARGWRGYDPYDGLSSPLAWVLPGKAARQTWTQFHRRSPVNLRGVFGIHPQLNSMAVALFALGSREARFLDMLEKLRSPEGGWGYPFPWQSRAFYAPPNTPNLICTALALKAYRRLGRTCDLKFVESLVREGAGERWITYIPQSDTQVHNINMTGAALLGRRDCMEFSVKRQRADGSWWYGEAANQRWIDNFHSGYNLVALREYEQATGDAQFAEAARRAFEYWDKTFWLSDGTPRYYHDRAYPLDIHCCAQGILTYLAYGEQPKANRLAWWALKNMWDEHGFFWYQRWPLWTNRICYMRWSEAWIYYALKELIDANENANC